jgi:rare lipoprotein A
MYLIALPKNNRTTGLFSFILFISLSSFNHALGQELYQTGICSYYGKKLHGRKTANGETFDMYAMTAAHKGFPFNTRIKVTNLKNNKSVIVRINDRGPYIGKQILDLSYGAAKK